MDGRTRNQFGFKVHEVSENTTKKFVFRWSLHPALPPLWLQVFCPWPRSLGVSQGLLDMERASTECTGVGLGGGHSRTAVRRGVCPEQSQSRVIWEPVMWTRTTLLCQSLSLAAARKLSASVLPSCSVCATRLRPRGSAHVAWMIIVIFCLSPLLFSVGCCGAQLVCCADAADRRGFLSKAASCRSPTESLVFTFGGAIRALPSRWP